MVYVASALGNEIRVFVLDAGDGTLEQVQQLGFEAGVGALALAPGQRFLYAMLRSAEPRIASIGVDACSGMLTILAQGPIAKPMAYLSTDRSGRFLLGASYADSAFAVVPIDDRGIAAGTATQVTTTPPQAHCIRTDASNRFLFITSLGGDRILQYRFAESTGQATPNDPPFASAPQGCGARHLLFHAAACVAYVNGELDGSIIVYGFDASNGRLDERQRVSALPDGLTAAPWAADLQMTPDGRFLYASERRTSTLAMFAVDAGSGRLEPRGSIVTEAQPRSFAIAPNGRFLFVAGERSQHLAMYAIDAATGELRLSERYRVGDKPSWVSVAGLTF